MNTRPARGESHNSRSTSESNSYVVTEGSFDIVVEYAYLEITFLAYDNDESRDVGALFEIKATDGFVFDKYCGTENLENFSHKKLLNFKEVIEIYLAQAYAYADAQSLVVDEMVEKDSADAREFLDNNDIEDYGDEPFYF